MNCFRFRLLSVFFVLLGPAYLSYGLVILRLVCFLVVVTAAIVCLERLVSALTYFVRVDCRVGR